jgi:hypothetical protein
MRLSRAALIAVILEEVPQRFHSRIHGGRVEIIGVFKTSQTHMPWLLGLRVKNRGRRHLYISVGEVRSRTGLDPVAMADVTLHWTKYDMTQAGIGDNEPAYRRLSERARRHGKDAAKRHKDGGTS